MEGGGRKVAAFFLFLRPGAHGGRRIAPGDRHRAEKIRLRRAGTVRITSPR